MKNVIVFLLSFTILFSSCNDEITPASEFGQGVYIINEGLFMQNNGSVTYFNPGSGKLVKNIFEIANNRPSGDIIQSLGLAGDSIGYMVVNGLSRVEVVRLSDFKAVAPPLAVEYPRYFVPVGATRGYLSQGSMAGNVFVIDIETHSVTDTIPVGFGPETITLIDNMAYVCNSGGFYRDSTISVINTINDQVTDTIYTGLCPAAIVKDNNGNLWTYCRGYAQYNESYTQIIRETSAELQKIDPVSGEVLWSGIVGSAGDYVTMFPKMASCSDGIKIYYLRPDGMYVLDCNAPVINPEAAIPGNFYGIFVHPENDEIYLFEASLAGNGKMKIFNEYFQERSEYEVGIMPNGAVWVE